MADIDIQPSALTDFARNSQIRLDAGSLQGLASTASSGKSQVPEGDEFFVNLRASIQQVMGFLSKADLGNLAYRDGAGNLAALFTTTDDQFDTTMRAATAAASSVSSTSPASQSD